jgi:hypothetical protein
MPGPLEPAERRGGTKQRRSPSSRRAPCSRGSGPCIPRIPSLFSGVSLDPRVRPPDHPACQVPVSMTIRKHRCPRTGSRAACGDSLSWERPGALWEHPAWVVGPVAADDGAGSCSGRKSGVLEPLEGPARTGALCPCGARRAERTPTGACRTAPRESPGVGVTSPKGRLVGGSVVQAAGGGCFDLAELDRGFHAEVRFGRPSLCVVDLQRVHLPVVQPGQTVKVDRLLGL